MGASLPAGLGPEPARFLDTPIFTTEPDRPVMVSLSSKAGTEEGDEGVRETREDFFKKSPLDTHL